MSTEICWTYVYQQIKFCSEKSSRNMYCSYCSIFWLKHLSDLSGICIRTQKCKCQTSNCYFMHWLNQAALKISQSCDQQVTEHLTTYFHQQLVPLTFFQITLHLYTCMNVMQVMLDLYYMGINILSPHTKNNMLYIQVQHIHLTWSIYMHNLILSFN